MYCSNKINLHSLLQLEVLWANDVIGDYLMDPEFLELLTGMGLTVMAMFAVKKFIRNVRGE